MKKHQGHFNLLCDIGDLADLLAESPDIEDFLRRTVRMVSDHLDADVCSIYLFDETLKELILTATKGLNPEAVGKVRMRPGEGLVGTTFHRMEPIREACASCNPHFKYFEEAHEDRFESFLAVPIQRGVQRIGVLVVQHERRNYFAEIDLMALRAAASQLAGSIENARLLMDLQAVGGSPSGRRVAETLQFVKGESASPGVAVGEVTVFKRSHGALLGATAEPRGEYGLEDFRRAIRTAAGELKVLQSRLAERLPESASLIFTAHFMILKDPKFVNRIEELIGGGTPPPVAVKTVANHYIDIFGASAHAYIREKVNDIEDLTGRILKILYNRPTEEAARTRETIVVARELYPSEILKFATEEIKGIVLVRGGITSHVAILARSLGIPLVIADRPELLDLPEGTRVLLDADIGNLYVRPSETVIRRFESQRRARAATARHTRAMTDTTHTRDGTRIRLLANINLLSELPTAIDLKAEGIGLYRTEFPFLIRPTFPSEAEQYLIYRRLFEEMAGREVTIRTLDVGGDKVLAYSNGATGANPELGLRSIRFSLRYRESFEGQIRAILRAAADSESVRIMFPMISSIDEFREAGRVVDDCIAALSQEGLPHHGNPAVGMMVELPAVLGLLEEFAREADFFSIGTNDFVQYMLAVDRTNEKVAEYYRPHHPSVLRALAAIAEGADRAGKMVVICGEMAHDPRYVPFLIGIGLRRMSVDPKYLPRLQARIADIDTAEARDHARELLAESTLQGVMEKMARRDEAPGTADRQ